MFKSKEDGSDCFESLFLFIVGINDNHWKLFISAIRSTMDFVCWRGLLTKILCTPYENREDWKIAAARYKGCIYLCEYDTQQKIENKRHEGVLQKEMSYWGFKFEQYVTTSKKA